MITKFALLNKNSRLCFPFIHCRAYVGQKISPNLDTIDPKSIQIKAYTPNKENYREKLQKIFNDLESQLGIRKTVIEQQEENYLIITGSRWWAIANPAVSLYTLLLRLYSKTLSLNPDGSIRKDSPEFKIGEDEEFLRPYKSTFSYTTNDSKDYLEIYPYILPFMKNLRGIFGNKRNPNYELGGANEIALNFTGINSFIMNTFDPENPNSRYIDLAHYFPRHTKYCENYITWLKKKRELIGV